MRKEHLEERELIVPGFKARPVGCISEFGEPTDKAKSIRARCFLYKGSVQSQNLKNVSVF